MKKFVAIALFLFSLGLYITTSVPTIYWGDSAEFATTSALLDISHPPSYPIYNILGKLFNFLPINSFGFKINLMSAYFAAYTVLILFLIIYYLPLNLDKKFKTIIGIFSSILFSFSYTFFQHAIKSEVYTLYTFFFCAIIFSLILLEYKKDNRFFYFAVFLFGLSLTNHLLIAFSLPALLFFVLTYNYKILFNIKNLSLCLLFLAIAFSLYIYLPLRSAKEPKINWARPQTIEGFKYVILLKEQGKLHQDFSKEIDVEDKETMKEAMREKFFKEGKTKDMRRAMTTDMSLYIFLIIVLPLYLSFALCYKKEYSKYLRNKKFIVLSVFFINIIYFLFVYVRSILVMPDFLKMSDLFNLARRDFSYKDAIISNLEYIFFLFIFLCSFTQNGRKKAIILSLSFTFILTIFVYSIFLGYVEYTKQQPVDFSAFVYFDILLKQFTIYGFVLGIIGILKLLFSNLRIFIFLWFLFLSYTILPVMIIFPENIPVIQERFSLPGYFVFSIFAGFGIKATIDFLNLLLKNIKPTTKLVLTNFAIIILLFSSLSPLFSYFKEINKSKYYFVKKYVDDIFLTLPKNSIILAKGIDTAFPLWYSNLVEKKRNDVTVIFLDALTQKWYIDNLENYKNLAIGNIEDNLKNQTKRRVLYTENIITNNINKRLVYYGGAPLFIPEGIKKGQVLPEGILFKIVKTPQYIITDKEVKRNIQLLNAYKFIKSLSRIDYQAKDILAIYAGGYYKLGINFLNQNNKEKVLKYFNKAMEIDRTFTPSYFTLFQIYLKDNNIDSAEKILKRGVKNNPKDVNLIFQLAHFYFKVGNPNKSIKLLDRLIKLRPNFVPSYMAKAEVYLNLNKREEGKKILEKVLKMEPDNQTAADILKQLE